MYEGMSVISRDDRGHYVLKVDGRDIGVYDTYTEAVEDLEEILYGDHS